MHKILSLLKPWWFLIVGNSLFIVVSVATRQYSFLLWYTGLIVVAQVLRLIMLYVVAPPVRRFFARKQAQEEVKWREKNWQYYRGSKEEK